MDIILDRNFERISHPGRGLHWNTRPQKRRRLRGSSIANWYRFWRSCIYSPFWIAQVSRPYDSILKHVLMISRIDIGNAKIAGLTDDLDIPSWKYEWLLTAFYITYVLFEWMTLMYRLVSPHIYVSLCVCGWGLVASFQSLATSFEAMLVLRMLLGVTEAAFGPGVPFYLSLFYKREELAFRIALFISAAPLATSFASTLAWVIVKLSHDGPIAPWRTLFLVEGFPSVVAAVFAWALIPDSPEKAHFLAPRERTVAELRLERNRKAGAYRDPQKGKFNWQEVRKTLADPKAYITAVSAHVFSPFDQIAEVLMVCLVHVLQL